MVSSSAHAVALFDMTQVLPVRHIMPVHRGTPAEDVVADEEIVHDANHHRNKGNTEEDANFMVELIDSHLVAELSALIRS